MSADRVRRFSLEALVKPLGDSWGQCGLGLSGNEHADMADRVRELLLVFGPDAIQQPLRCNRRYQGVVVGVDAEHRHGDLLEIDQLAAKFELSFNQLVLLKQVFDELAQDFPWLVGAVENPALHAQEVGQSIRIGHGVNQVNVLLHAKGEGRKVLVGLVHEVTRNNPVRIDQQVNIHLLAPGKQQSVIGFEVDRRHHSDQVLNLLWMKCCVDGREGSPLADTEQVDCVKLMLLADVIYAVINKAVD